MHHLRSTKVTLIPMEYSTSAFYRGDGAVWQPLLGISAFCFPIMSAQPCMDKLGVKTISTAPLNYWLLKRKILRSMVK